MTFIQGTGMTNFLTPHMSAKCLYRGTPLAAAPACRSSAWFDAVSMQVCGRGGGTRRIHTRLAVTVFERLFHECVEIGSTGVLTHTNWRADMHKHTPLLLHLSTGMHKHTPLGIYDNTRMGAGTTCEHTTCEHTHLGSGHGHGQDGVGTDVGLVGRAVHLDELCAIACA